MALSREQLREQLRTMSREEKLAYLELLKARKRQLEDPYRALILKGVIGDIWGI